MQRSAILSLIALNILTQMRLFHPVNSLFVSRNMWPILLSKV
jgi:hypothetical protein